MKKLLGILLVLVMALGCAAVVSAEEPIKIGATYYSLQNEFTMRMDNAAKKYCEENGITLYSYDGNYDAATQLSQVETMIADGVDAIILNPHDAVACAACVDLAYEAGIPVVGVNTMVQSEKLTSYVGSQDVSAGEDILNYMIKYLGKEEFSIVIIEGPMGQSAQLQRIEGIENVMAAHQAINAAGLNIPCIGIDGITDAVAAIQSGDMIASDFQNAEGQMTGAIEVALKAIKGEAVDPFYWIPFELITPENAADYVNKY